MNAKTPLFDKDHFQASVKRQLRSRCGQTITTATPHDVYQAMASALAEFTTHDLLATEQDPRLQQAKHVNYLSLEFLIGRLTGNNLLNMDLYSELSEAMSELGYSLTDLLEEERDPSLGNGGLGRLAACFMDACAALQYPTVGYGLHYRYGLFKQSFVEGRQHEEPDAWQDVTGYPWEVARPQLTQKIGLYGTVTRKQVNGVERDEWQPARYILAVPWDIPVVGYHNRSVYPLRLWECRAPAPFSLTAFNEGQYMTAHQAQIQASSITEVLYPNDNHQEGKALRLTQQYCHSAASMADILRRHQAAGHDLASLPDYQTIQLNDTHPTIAIPEMMRLLMDEHSLSWDAAWAICTRLFAYTNHTLMPEALETWPVALIGQLLPRHLQIIEQINERFLQHVAEQWPGDEAKQQKLAIISRDQEPVVRMAHLCVVASYAVNGVAALHSELLKNQLFPEFAQLYPGRLKNVTNGITPRRWLAYCNPGLSALISEYIGEDWPADLAQLERLSAWANDSTFQRRYMEVKQANKQRLANWVARNMGIELDTHAIFDVQIKRLHEYKRQHLSLLHIIAVYHRLLTDPNFSIPPRVVIFAAKAAPGYELAKEIIFAINRVADTINNDARVNQYLKVVFIPDYRVSLAELIIPAADVSEQISTAGKEASGTGNMKLALNGALTIGTLDGANIEIKEAVGDDNIFTFGLDVDQVNALVDKGYQPLEYYHADPLLKASLDMLKGAVFTPEQPGLLAPVYDSLLSGGDPYLCLADFAAYDAAQRALEAVYQQPQQWAHKAILNTALVGQFSADRAIEDYVRDIWQLTAVAR